jgi:hypothetical protein
MLEVFAFLVYPKRESDLCFVQKFRRRRNMRRYLFVSYLVLAVAALFSATPAQADGIDTFTYQSGDNTFTWELQSSPDPTLANFSPVPSLGFLMSDVVYFENGIPQGPALFEFLLFPGGGGGFELIDTIQGTHPILASGPQIFSGSELTPTFLTGIFPLTDTAVDPKGVATTLRITAVPEPSSLMLLGTGLALLGFALKKTIA